MRSDRVVDVAIAGGGVIGLSVAWALARRGVATLVVNDPNRQAAAWAAAGMLTPVTEAWWGEDRLLRLGAEALASWPEFARLLTDQTGMDVGLRLDGVLVAGVRSDDMALVGELARATTSLGGEVRMLRSSDVRTVEPLLSPRVRGGFVAPGEGAVDPRRLVAALGSACRALGVQVMDGRTDAVVVTGRRVQGLETSEGRLVASQVVLAAGSWSRQVDIPGAPHPPVHPVFGESLRLSQEDPRMVPGRVVRGYVNGRPIYVVPRTAPEGTPREIVVGATSSEMGFRRDPTALGVHDLLCDARTLVPALDEATFCEVSVGLRPATPDNLPLVGRTEVDGLVLACGHHRNGVLLAPLTADAVTRIVCGGEPTELDVLFQPARFSDRTGGRPCEEREETPGPIAGDRATGVREV